MVLGAVLCVVALPGGAAASGVAAARPGQTAVEESPDPYAFDRDVKEVDGAASTSGSRTLVPGATYRSAIGHPGGGDEDGAGSSGPSTGSGGSGGSGSTGSELYYRLELDAKDSAYVSVTALPGPRGRVVYEDGIRVSVQDADGFICDQGSVLIGRAQSPRPLTASAKRQIGADQKKCQTAGTYYAVVERTTNSRSRVSSTPQKPSSPEDWDLELYVASEPALAKAGPTTPPQDTDSTPQQQPPAGAPMPRAGGSSFGTARALGKGVWGDRVRAGQTRFYRVPLDWGQRLSATLELGSGTRTGDFVTSALTMELFNPVRGPVVDYDIPYDGRQKSMALAPLPPVAYENRYAPFDRTSGMRFAGWYYLVVHLDPDVGKRFGVAETGLTLRVGVEGQRRPAPAYAGAARPADGFGVTERDEDAARNGAAGSAGGGGSARREPGSDGSAAASEGDTAMKVLAAAGFGTGTVLLAVLGVWRAVSRRRLGRVSA
ncbi:hypothetical protein [Streptomyces flavofungini]|uniref:hypothetical protein n=1 Tax=Streptomyces flavofungini TaxID=68200 RepID=UPI0025AEF05D|nr:hypothetical protein [Streptomyces flavofungini]WJV47514.1 hypothetical protein QUY26_19470 [Streptomyces flavofungini]